LKRFERNISILGRSERTFENYIRHIAAMPLHFQCLPTELDEELIKDYLYELQQRSKTQLMHMPPLKPMKTGY